MKSIVSFDQAVGPDGGKVGGGLSVETGSLKLNVHASFPIEKMIEPLTKAVDNLLNKLEEAIPGDWDKPMIEKFKGEYKEELIKLLAE